MLAKNFLFPAGPSTVTMPDPSNACCICELPILGWGHNPWPWANLQENPGAKCCSACNDMYVIPARIELIVGSLMVK
jgi:hypothetical protein